MFNIDFQASYQHIFSLFLDLIYIYTMDKTRLFNYFGSDLRGSHPLRLEFLELQ